MMRFESILTLPSGNLARNFRFNDRGYGRVQASYEYTGIIPLDAPESTGEATMVAQFDEDVVCGRSIIVDEEEDGTINPVFAKDEITGTFAECVRIWLA